MTRRTVHLRRRVAVSLRHLRWATLWGMSTMLHCLLSRLHDHLHHPRVHRRCALGRAAVKGIHQFFSEKPRPSGRGGRGVRALARKLPLTLAQNVLYWNA
jgi:hypothetical protein